MREDLTLPVPAAKPADPVRVGHTSPLIVTKIRVPRRRHDMLPRRRLVNFIHLHLDRKLILISAPAGYGKTSLLTDFAHDTDLPVCWYSLDRFDQDLHVFLEHFIAAIAARFPAFGERSRTFLADLKDPSRSLYPIVAILVQEIYDTIPEYFVLVLDDHHAVEVQEAINEFLDLFVTYVDENCHLILASRTLPALPNLSLLVSRRQAAGLSIDELRFTPQEIRALAQQNYNRQLTADQAAKLAQQTGGWITGLLLTAVSQWRPEEEEIPLQGKINVGIYDYLSRQVLAQQPTRLREFLLASSVLDELSPDLCSSLLQDNQTHPENLLRQLRARNLFVIEFEGDDGRLRYHDLFRDFLRSNLRRQDEALFHRLNRQAADMYAARGEWERAITRYLDLNDYEAAADLIEQCANQMYEAGRKDTLAHWIDSLPDKALAERPHFLVHRGKIHSDRSEHASALRLYDQAGKAFTEIGDTPWAAFALAMKANTLRFQGRYTDAMARSGEALALIELHAPSANQVTDREKATLALAHKNIGLCQLRMGRLSKSREALGAALGLYRDLDTPHDIGSVYHDLGVGYEMAGDLDRAVEHYQAALRRWEQLGNLGPWANTLNSLGVIYHLLGRYDDALDTLTDALAKVQQAADFRVEAATLASLGDLHRDLGAYEQARRSYTDSLEAANKAGGGFIVTYALDALGNTHRLRGDRSQARKLLVGALDRAEEHGSSYELGLCRTSLGILAGDEGDLTTALEHLDQAVELFGEGGFERDLARALFHRAHVSFKAGTGEESMADLHRALRLADQLGYDQFLVVEGLGLLPMLRHVLQHDEGGRGLPDLVRRIEDHRAERRRRPEPTVEVGPQRELKVYALGQPRVELDGESVQWATAQSRNLLYFLLQHPLGLRKEEIGSAFWPDHSPHKLDGIFRSTLYRLRRSLVRESVVYEEGVYRFNALIDHWFDVAAFQELLERAERTEDSAVRVNILEQALDLYQGDYLEGIYEDWCVVERERLRESYLDAEEALASLHARQGYLQQAIKGYQHLLEEDPYREAAHRDLMRCYYRQGDRAAAIRQYRTCVRILLQDLGLSPSMETEKLYLEVIE
jgi:ATP/maltotriose-dependent transcriptional regulator MalT